MIVLTKEPTPTGAGGTGMVGGIVPRTAKYYDEIEALSEEIEKGVRGGLRTDNGGSTAVDARALSFRWALPSMVKTHL